jgi:uncharacterized protein
MPQRVPVKEGLFQESPEGSVLVGSKCKNCGQIFFPKVKFCFTCLSENVEDFKLSRQGKLYTYTIGRMPSVHFQPPFAVGYVELPEGLKIFTPLKIDDKKPFKIGMEMEVSIEKLWQDGDKEVIGFIFKPI